MPLSPTLVLAARQGFLGLVGAVPARVLPTRHVIVLDRRAMALVTLILPTLNEHRFDVAIGALTDHLLGIAGKQFEILVVDDSKGEARAKLERWVAERAHLAPRIDVRLIAGARRGKGHAARLGALISRGDFVFLIDADLPVPLHYINEFLVLLESGNCDLVIGQRPSARNAGHPLRHLLSRSLYLLQRSVVFQRREFGDTQCGFKAFLGPVLRSLATRQITDGGMYDIEYLYVALRDGLRVASVAVTPQPESRPSKINFWKCVYTDPVALVRIKARGITGGYDR